MEEDNFDKDFEASVGQYLNTSGHKKLKNYVLALFEDKKFIEEVKKIRKKLGIVSGQDLIPLTEAGIKKVNAFHKEVDSLLLKYNLNYMWADTISMFVIDFTKDGASWGTICELQDVFELKEDPFSDSYTELEDNAFPISLRISPYASQRDIIDYVKKLYNTDIKRLQEKYLDENIEIGKFRSKKENIKKRNDFIVKNQHLPAKEIASLVVKEFGEHLDYALVSKIIYLSKRK